MREGVGGGVGLALRAAKIDAASARSSAVVTGIGIRSRMEEMLSEGEGGTLLQSAPKVWGLVSPSPSVFDCAGSWHTGMLAAQAIGC